QAEDGIRDATVTGVQTCALPIYIFLRLPARRVGVPAVAVPHRAPRRPGKSAAEDDRRVRLLHRLWPGLDRVEFDDLAVIFGCLLDRKSTRLNSSHGSLSYAVFFF